jgi:hypothetical protein
MGLDWNPGNKPKFGFEEEFNELWTVLQSKGIPEDDIRVKRFHDISIPAWDTLNVPRVGFDATATQWAIERYPNRKDKTLTQEQFLLGMQGFRVLDLVPPCDGLPQYTNGYPGGYVEAYAFRGQFLRDCTEIIGEELLESAFHSKLPLDTIKFGRELLRRASNFADKHGYDLSTVCLVDDPDSTEFHLDVVQSAGKWCVFWGEHDHWLEAY